MSDRTIIALDVGRSEVRMIADYKGKREVITCSGYVMPAARMPHSDEGIEYDGQKYYVGETARIQGLADMTVGTDPNWIMKMEFRILCLWAFERLAKRGVPGLDNPLVIIGTSASLYTSQRNKLEEIVRTIIPGEVKAISQPMGVYLSYMLDNRGVPHRERRLGPSGGKPSWAVLQVGHFTSDFLFIKEGINVEIKASTCPGMITAINALNFDLTSKGYAAQTDVRCLKSLLTGRTMVAGAEIEIRDEVDRALVVAANRIRAGFYRHFYDDTDELAGMVLAGGGAELIYPLIRDLMHNVILLENPRMAVVEGYMRYAKSGELRKGIADLKVVELHG